jgi:hypothetical protein
MFAFIRAIYNALVNPLTLVNLVLNVYPRSAAGVSAAPVTLTATATAWTYGSWAQIVASSVSNCTLAGFTLENFVGAQSDGEVQIGTGGAGSEAAVATFDCVAAQRDIRLGPYIAAGTRIAARYRTSTGAADTVQIKINVVEGIQTGV